MNEYEDKMDYLDMYLDMDKWFHRIIMKYYYKPKLYKKIPKTNYMRHAKILCNTILALRAQRELDEQETEIECKRLLQEDADIQKLGFVPNRAVSKPDYKNLKVYTENKEGELIPLETENREYIRLQIIRSKARLKRISNLRIPQIDRLEMIRNEVDKRLQEDMDNMGLNSTTINKRKYISKVNVSLPKMRFD